MFEELLPILRHRAVLFTVAHLDNDDLRVNIIPQKIKDSDNEALMTPLSLTGPAEELDAHLSGILVSYVSSHLQLANTLSRAQAEMDAAAKAAQTEARAKSKVASSPNKPIEKVTALEPESKEAIPAPAARGLSLFDSMEISEETARDEDEEAAVLDDLAGEAALRVTTDDLHFVREESLQAPCGESSSGSV